MNKLVWYNMLTTAKFPGAFIYHFIQQWEDNYIKIMDGNQCDNLIAEIIVQQLLCMHRAVAVQLYLCNSMAH